MTAPTRLAAALGASALAAIPTTVVASTYVVAPGDTLGDIAIRHGTTVSALLDANPVTAVDALEAGQLLRIPDPALLLPVYARGGVDVETYSVQAPGESVVAIARRFGVDATALARANGIGVNAPLAKGAELQIPGRLARMNALLAFAAAETRVDADMVRAVAWVESGWRQDAVSATGAVGVMQLEPSTGEWVSAHLAGRRLDIGLAQDNVLAGSLLLRHLHEHHRGDVDAVLAGYYQGDASVAKHGRFEDTRRYQDRVQALLTPEGVLVA